MNKKELIINQCELLCEIPAYRTAIAEYLECYNSHENPIDKISLGNRYFVFKNLLNTSNHDIIDNIEAFNISWMDGYDWNTVSEADVSKNFINAFKDLELQKYNPEKLEGDDNLTVKQVIEALEGCPQGMKVVVPIAEEHNANSILGYYYARTMGIIHDKYDPCNVVVIAGSEGGKDISDICNKECDELL